MFPYSRDPLTGEPGEGGTPCATPDCDHVVTFPEFEVFCSTCLIAQRNRAHQREQEAPRPPKTVKARALREAQQQAEEIERRR